jgi:hypothetical protein
MLAKEDQPSPDSDFEKSKLKKLRRRNYFFLPRKRVDPTHCFSGFEFGLAYFSHVQKKILIYMHFYPSSLDKLMSPDPGPTFLDLIFLCHTHVEF